VPARSIAPRLKYLCSAEGIRCSDQAIHAIAESAEGDIRSAVNMLYASAIGRNDLSDAQVHTSQKDERVSIFTLISAIFGRTPDDELLRLSYDVDDTPETIEQWVEGNIHAITDDHSVNNAYRCLARADEYLGYTYRRQYHTLWRYATALMLLGVAGAAGGKGIHARILPPGRWQKMATAKRQKAIRTATLNRVAGMIHIPQTTLRENYLGTITMLVGSNPAAYAKGLPLDADQLNFFLNDKSLTTATMKAIALEEKAKEPVKEPAKKPKVDKKEKIREPQTSSPVPPPVDEPEDKKTPAKSQSTLFDGF
jgi:replication factor C large subunit